MATTYKILGQVIPSANVDTTAYTVPAVTTALVSSIVVANQSASSGTFRIAARVNGASLAAKQYLYYDTSIGANTASLSVQMLELGLTLAAGDVITVRSSSGAISFQVFGVELT